MAVRVLVVDDSPSMRLLVRILLEDDGRSAVVGEAADGQEAVREAEVRQPDVVVLDVQMPVQDGLHALPALRRVAPRAEVVVLSCADEQDLAERAVQAGARIYLRKDDQLEDLVEAVAGLAC